MQIGAHQSAAGGPHKAIERAIEDGCEALQIFTKNNNRWKQRAWTEKEANMFRTAYAESDLKGLISHASYLINLCSAREDVRQKSVDALVDEMDRCAQLGVPLLCMHPGSPGELGPQWGLETIANAVNAIWEEHGDRWQDVTLCFENTAGQGSNLGWQHEELRDIFARLTNPDSFGVIFDTCHAHAGGYDLRTIDGYQEHWELFDELIGIKRLKAFHLNDSKKPLGSRLDRHESIAQGDIGATVFEQLVNDPRFAKTPAVVETPPLESGEMSFAVNVARLKSYRN